MLLRHRACCVIPNEPADVGIMSTTVPHCAHACLGRLVDLWRHKERRNRGRRYTARETQVQLGFLIEICGYWSRQTLCKTGVRFVLSTGHWSPMPSLVHPPPYPAIPVRVHARFLRVGMRAGNSAVAHALGQTCVKDCARVSVANNVRAPGCVWMKLYNLCPKWRTSGLFWKRWGFAFILLLYNK